MKVLRRGITDEQRNRVGIFECPECTSLIDFDAYDLVRWSTPNTDTPHSAQCPVCGGRIPETARKE